jgi:SAM-dependent methyltransferase
LPPEQFVTALYRSILGREPDTAGLAAHLCSLASGETPEGLVRSFLSSPEGRARMTAGTVPPLELPALTQTMNERFETHWIEGNRLTVYRAASDQDIVRMESLIERYRYYDRLDVWSPVIDLDKEIIARIVLGLGARSCFELGCFTGPVLSLLAEAGVTVLGAEVSHYAFVFAYPNIRTAMLYGDLLTLSVKRRFDVILCMDVLEHLSPLRLDDYIARLSDILEEDGFIYLNSPMWGNDRVFGDVAPQYLEPWRGVGDASFWRYWPCDERGWPEHGHLVWASPRWWEGKFADHGLYRDPEIEGVIHRRLADFFAQAPSRRMLFVLRKPQNRRSTSIVARELDAALAALLNPSPTPQ